MKISSHNEGIVEESMKDRGKTYHPNAFEKED